MKSSGVVFAVTAAVLWVGSVLPVASANTVHLRVDSVSVERQAQVGGDQPYFATIWFRSRMCTRDSTAVEVVGRGPHDWVSKARYHRGLLGGPDRMHRGRTLPIPAWQGEFSWDDVTLVPLAGPDGRVHPDAVRADVLGVAIIGLDHRGTPPQAVHALLERAAETTRRILREEIEGCRLPADFAAWRGIGEISHRAGQRLGRLVDRVVGEWDVGGWARILADASDLPQDGLTGINFVLLPAVTGLRDVRPVSERLDGLPGRAIRVQTWVLSPSRVSDRLVFEGSSGGRYVAPVQVGLTPGGGPEAIAERLHLNIRTGANRLRGGDHNVLGSVLVAGRWTPEAVLNQRRVWHGDTPYLSMIRLPPLSRVRDIEAVRLRTTFPRAGSADEVWDMDAIGIEWRGAWGTNGVLAERSGQPYKRFQADDHEMLIRF